MANAETDPIKETQDLELVTRRPFTVDLNEGETIEIWVDGVLVQRYRVELNRRFVGRVILDGNMRRLRPEVVSEDPT
jgi:hypothetical protein